MSLQLFHINVVCQRIFVRNLACKYERLLDAIPVLVRGNWIMFRSHMITWSNQDFISLCSNPKHQKFISSLLSLNHRVSLHNKERKWLCVTLFNNRIYLLSKSRVFNMIGWLTSFTIEVQRNANWFVRCTDNVDFK